MAYYEVDGEPLKADSLEEVFGILNSRLPAFQARRIQKGQQPVTKVGIAGPEIFYEVEGDKLTGRTVGPKD